jgi:hypothetical protein
MAVHVTDVQNLCVGSKQPMKLQVGSEAEPGFTEAYAALCRVQGDNPYLAKLSNTLSATCYYACKWCYCQGSTKIATPDGIGLESLRATVRQSSEGTWRWERIDNHCFQHPDGSLSTAGGSLLFTNSAHQQRALLAEWHGREAADQAAQRCSNGAPVCAGASLRPVKFDIACDRPVLH